MQIPPILVLPKSVIVCRLEFGLRPTIDLFEIVRHRCIDRDSQLYRMPAEQLWNK